MIKVPKQQQYQDLIRHCVRSYQSCQYQSDAVTEVLKPENFNTLKLLYRSVRQESLRQHKMLLLLGRDTWVWYVLSQRDIAFRDNVIFDPRISTEVAESFKQELTNIYTPQEYFMFDTGFYGTIPKILGFKPGINFKLGAAESSEMFRNHKVFSKEFNILMYLIETLPKFWHKGVPKDNKIWQELDKFDFKTVANITERVYTHA